MSIFRIGRHVRLCRPALVFSRQYAASATLPASFPSGVENVEQEPKKKKRKTSRPKAPPKEIPEPETVLDNSPVHSHLAQIAASKATVTLDDIERHKPARHANPDRDHNKYTEEYATLQDLLSKSFSQKQLREFLRLYGLKPPQIKSKATFASLIMEKAWNYPPLDEVLRKNRDRTESTSETFQLEPHQSFLLLGKDGINLHNLARKHQLQVAFSAKPLSLTATGLRANLQALGEYITEFKENIRSETFNIPTQMSLRPEQLQRVSRTAGAFTENCGDGQIRISYKADAPKASLLAKRHATRASCESSLPSGVDLLASATPTSTYTSTGPANSLCSLYPFFSARTLPWTTEVGGAFRLRRIGELSGYGSTEHIQREGPLSSINTHLTSLSNKYTDIRSIFQSMMMGHVLLTTPPKARGKLAPPLEGTLPIDDVFSWLRPNPCDRVFIPSLPSMLSDQDSARQRLLHRLVYRVFNQQSSSNPLQPLKTMRFEMVLQPGASEEGVNIDEPLVHRCLIGEESTIDLMLPERPMDIQISASKTSSLQQEQWPPELTSYVSELEKYIRDETGEQSQPETTPLNFTHNGDLYILNSSASVRQLLSETDPDSVTESLLDLENNRKTSECKVTCDDPSSDAKWNKFVETCDQLSSAIPKIHPRENSTQSRMFPDRLD
ncbi:hypothetical protein BDZ89DRAFT_1058911 [Hymenopellis radicata]|nr:hypothetical protein BDZ89DRAFT_1058911 [Hymenopellis radicata]